MRPSKLLLLAALALAFATSAPRAARAGDGPHWPLAIKEVQYRSKADNTDQPAMFYAPGRNEARPLLVGLHTWSHGHRQRWSVPYAQWCMKKGWAFIHPHFRGPNNRPEAMGSELVIQDILSAVEYARANAQVDESRIYLAGYSSGGMVALLVAARAPKLFAGVSAWGPVIDVCKWHGQTRRLGLSKYTRDVELSLGGPPQASSAAAEQCRKRSPLTTLASARGVAIDLNAGIFDGHGGKNIVPVSHSLDAFNLLAEAPHRLTPEDIKKISVHGSVPKHLRGTAVKDPSYGSTGVMFRRQSSNVRITVFQGGHIILYDSAMKWLAQQHK